MKGLRRTGRSAVGVKTASLAVGGFLVAVALGGVAAGAPLRGSEDPSPGAGATLSVEKSAPEHVSTDIEFEYEITVTNTGDATASDVVLGDTLPDMLEVVSLGAGCAEDVPGQIACDLGPIAPGGSVSTEIAVTAAGVGTIENTAEATAANADPASDSATTVVGDTTLSIDKTGPETAAAGTRLAYQIVVENTGPVMAFGVDVEDVLPAGVSAVQFDDDCQLTDDDTVVFCDLGDIPVEEERQVDVSFVVAEPGEITNRAQVSGSNMGTDPEDSATTDVQDGDDSASVDLNVTKSGPSSAVTGEQVEYTIEVTNEGDLDATETRIRENLPANTVLVSARLGDQLVDCPVTSGAPTCFIGTIEPEESRTLVVTIQRSTAGSATNSVVVSSGEDDADGDDNSASATTTFSTPGTPGPDAVVDDPGCRANELTRNDDSSTPAVGLGFAVNFFGTMYTHAFVNNNGNITFGSALGTYTPFELNANTPPIIAPFFADVDTRGVASDTVHYSFGPITFMGRPAFCVDWVNVGYYSGHTDKLNSIQLLLVDRSDIGVGDFDMVFNYDRILWETGDASGGSAGFGGTSAGVGYSAGNGNPAAFFQFPGSRVNGALLDSNSATGLIHNRRGTLQLGRYVFPVRNGSAPAGGAIAGIIRDSTEAPIAGAPVQVCPAAGGACSFVTATNGAGEYNATGLPEGDYTVAAYPPAGSSRSPRTVGPLAVTASSTLTQDIVLTRPNPPPPGTSIFPARSGGEIPVVFWGEPVQLSTTGCAGGTASYEVTEDAAVAAAGAMTQGPAGTYTATVPPLSPVRGLAHVRITLVCPDPAGNGSVQFNVYIDPSGVVRTPGGSPIAGARVTLLRADTSAGPFLPVPDGSEIMSPQNRTNPDQTDAAGHFGWDVISGFYVVRAEKAGCHAPGLPEQAFVESAVLTIPPPVTDLDLRLAGPGCPESSAPAPPTERPAPPSSDPDPPPVTTEPEPSPAPPLPPPPAPEEPGTFNAQPTEGIILVNGERIDGTVEIESGDVVDATNGTIEIASDSGRAEFFEGAFKLTQPTVDNAITQVELVGGDFSACEAARRTAGRRADDKPVRRLWGRGTGKFRTKARYSSATVRGTLWLTADLCRGSLTLAEEGTVVVYDFSLRRTRVLAAGGEYLAEEPPPPTPGRFVGDPKGQVIVNGTPVDQDTQIRSGDTVDVRNGSIELRTTSGEATFHSGRFLVTQVGGDAAFTLLTLVGGDFSSCSARARKLSSSSDDPPKKPVRSLWGSGKGKFRTKSRFSSATVRGTIWLTVDRCDGSLTLVREGTVEVFDLTQRRTVQVGPGQRYLAPAPTG